MNNLVSQMLDEGKKPFTTLECLATIRIYITYLIIEVTIIIIYILLVTVRLYCIIFIIKISIIILDDYPL